MQNAQHQNIVSFIWSIANKLRGPYRPPQYRRVMLPLIVLRRFDLVQAENKQKVVERVVKKTDLLASRVSLIIKKLKEYRSALITNAVTGKIDLRGVQISPPVQLPAKEPAHA